MKKVVLEEQRWEMILSKEMLHLFKWASGTGSSVAELPSPECLPPQSAELEPRLRPAPCGGLLGGGGLLGIHKHVTSGDFGLKAQRRRAMQVLDEPSPPLTLPCRARKTVFCASVFIPPSPGCLAFPWIH